MSETARPSTLTIVRIVLVYAVFASLWILLSDKAVDWLLHDRLQLLIVHTLKGWLFVAVTSLLLYGMLRRLASDNGQNDATPPSAKSWNLPLALTAAVIVAATSIAIAQTLRDHRTIEVSKVEAISNLKANEVVHWLEERRGDADFFRTSFFLADLYRQWQQAGDAESGNTLQQRLIDLNKSSRYRGIRLFDHQGRFLWGTPGTEPAVDDEQAHAMDLGRRDLDMHWAVGHRTGKEVPSIEYVVPLAKLGDAAPFLVLEIDPSDWIYDSVQTWPLPTETGEVLLFRRHGDHVEFLNARKHLETADQLPVASTAANRQIYAKILSGELPLKQVITGLGYRQVPVLAVAQSIPGTDWTLIAKIEESEAYAGALAQAVWISLAGLLVLFVTAASGQLLRQREQLAVAASLRKSQDERLKATQLLSAIAEGSDDAIFAKDPQGRYILFNRAAGRFVGQTPENALGKDDRALFPEEQAAMLMELGRRVIEEDRPITIEETLDTVDGPKVFLATKGPLRDAAGKVVGLFGISRDITQLKETERSLRESEERLRLAQSAASVGIWDWNTQTGKVVWTPELERLYGYSPGTFPGTYEAYCRRVHPEDLPYVEQQRDAAVEAHLPFEFDFRIVPDDRTVRWVNCKGAAVYDEAGNPMRVFGVNIDITQRKRNEEALADQARELRIRNEELQRFNRATVGRELDMIRLKQEINELSKQLGREPPYSLDFLGQSAPPVAGDP
jgi:PAS domain S-box-containing protein